IASGRMAPSSNGAKPKQPDKTERTTDHFAAAGDVPAGMAVQATSVNRLTTERTRTSLQHGEAPTPNTIMRLSTSKRTLSSAADIKNRFDRSPAIRGPIDNVGHRK
ncbi:MAG TPA: hypothetical protein VMU41_13120, partial [Candidatus Binataceae bacterium]|nr:hypothetical protein [Candidatus Binataceae bacterium]